METKKKYPLAVKNTIGNTVMGILWILAGILSIPDGIIFNILSLLVFICIIVTILFTMKIKFEEDDEMSERHYYMAKSKTYDILLIAFLLVSVLGSVTHMTNMTLITNWKAWVMILLGCMQFICGLYFRKLERDGDE